ncbi:MAG TPA: tripartite tricarboxylate transporter substrate binding protein [Nitrospinota bacterium]|nr:tripartite tricarboxylate transporter substrate binding protein [Nitrospinota bacterium]
MRKIRRILISITVLWAGAAFIAPASAEFPEKAVQFIIPFGAGGGADIEGRLLAKGMAKVLGQPVIPVNKPGAGGSVTYTFVKNAKPDGYTVAWNSTSILTSTNIGNVNFTYNALDHVGRVEFQPMPFVVRADSKWKTFQEFVADCKKNPDKYKVANSTTGSATHLAAIAMTNAAGCKVIHLPLGIKRRNAGLLSGEADAMAAPLTGAIRLARAGKFRILAVPSVKRNAVIPDVPTLSELGYPAVIDLFRGLSVPKGTPDAVKTRIADAMTKAARSAAFTKLGKKKGFTIAPQNAAAFEAYLAKMNRDVIAIMKSAGIYQSKRK